MISTIPTSQIQASPLTIQHIAAFASFTYCPYSHQYRFDTKMLLDGIGYHPQELEALGSGLQQILFHPEDYERAGTHDKAIRSLGNAQGYSYMVRLLCTDNKYHWFLCRIRAFLPQDSEVMMYSGTWTIMPADTHLEAQLAAERMRFKAIYNNTTDLNVFLDPSGKLLSVNQTAERYIKKYFGYHLNEGATVFALLPRRWACQLRSAFHKAMLGKMGDLELSWTFDNAHAVTFRFRFFPVYFTPEQICGVNINANNITRLNAAKQQVENKNRQLRQIAQFNAHQVRKPLASIMGLLHLINLQYNHPATQPELREMLDALEVAAHELDHVIVSVVHTASGEQS